MILSWQHRFIFIKGRKVAGTSVESALACLCGPDDIITPITPIDEAARIPAGGGARNYSRRRGAEAAYLEAILTTPADQLPSLKPPPRRFYHHMPLRSVIWRTGLRALSLPVTCVERHPYSKVLSWANMAVTFSAYRAGGDMRASEDQVRDSLRRVVADGSIRKVSNIDLYRGFDGRIRVNLLRYEQLQDDFDRFARTLGVQDPPRLPHVKKGVMAEPANLTAYLSQEELNRVDAVFRPEFEAFGYTPLRA